jgi:hypothetical protein
VGRNAKTHRENFVKNITKWLPEAFVLALAAVVRLPALGGPPLTVSETRIWMFARDGWAHLWLLFGLGADFNTGTVFPYLWLLKFCMKLFGTTEAWLRAPSAAAGLATVIVLYFFARRVFGRWAAVIAAALLAAAPYHVAASRTAGPAAIGILLCALGLLLFHRIYEGRRDAATVAGFAAVMLIGVNFSFYSALLLLPMNILFIGFARDRTKALWWWIPLNAALIGCVVFWEPRLAATFFSRPPAWAATEEQALHDLVPNESIVGLKTQLIFLEKYYLFVFTLGGFYFSGEWLANGWSVIGWIAVAVSCHYFPYLGFREYEGGYRARVFAFIMLGAMLGVAALLSFTAAPAWETLLPAVLIFLPVIGNGAARFSGWRGKSLLAVLLLSTVFGFVPMQREEEQARPDWRSAARFLETAPGGRETVVLTDGGAATLPLFYYGGKLGNRIVSLMPDIDLETIGGRSGGESRFRQEEVLPVIRGTVDSRPPDGLANLFSANDRLWIVRRGADLPENPRWAREYAIWIIGAADVILEKKVDNWGAKPGKSRAKPRSGQGSALKGNLLNEKKNEDLDYNAIRLQLIQRKTE